MTEPMAPQGITSTLPPLPANGSGRLPPTAPLAARRAPLQTRLRGMRTTLIAALAALVVAVIFTIQNAHAANISFLGVHLELPLAGALLLAAIAGCLLTVAAGSARITWLRQLMQRGLREARTGKAAPATAASPLQGLRRRPRPSASAAASDVPAAQHLPAPVTDLGAGYGTDE
jgi:uncharacterized integral membrane protein